MASYVIAGASRGLGYAFVKELAKNPKNIIVGLVRNRNATNKQLEADSLAGKNLTIIEADMTDRHANEVAATATAKLTGRGGVDYVIVKGAYINQETEFMNMDDLSKEPEFLDSQLDTHFKVNVNGVIKTFNAFVPLLRKGTIKKAIFISTGVADIDTINKNGFVFTGAYAISKAAANTAVALYSAIYSQEGILFMSVSPGVVNTARHADLTAEQQKGMEHMFSTLKKMKPGFSVLNPEESAQMCLNMMDKASIENGDGGSFVSHHGDKEWL